VPELVALPTRFVHDPSSAPASLLHTAGVELGQSYPVPLIGHTEARTRALAAYAAARGRA
jgi:deoxyribodipyrimidine photo-lyase